METDNLLQCYNRACGQKYYPEKNQDDSCRHHPGMPFFQDAYKGWSCCDKKSTDFTVFLNIKGCTSSKHSNIKPPETEKPKQSISSTPLTKPKERPPFDAPLKTMSPEILFNLKQQNFGEKQELKGHGHLLGEIYIGTPCRNRGCTVSYQGPDSKFGTCVFHPGKAVFHERVKFWSCCQKQTTDFDEFLNQPGCNPGQHVWFKEAGKAMQCRWDYHQTGTHMVVSIYAKQYCIQKTELKLNPVRLYANILFPLQNNAAFNMDLELRGIIDVEASQVFFYETKVEIKMKKADPGNWSRLDIPRPAEKEKEPKTMTKKTQRLTLEIDALDLDDSTDDSDDL